MNRWATVSASSVTISNRGRRRPDITLSAGHHRNAMRVLTLEMSERNAFAGQWHVAQNPSPHQRTVVRVVLAGGGDAADLIDDLLQLVEVIGNPAGQLRIFC